MADIEKVKQLREQTAVSLSECKKALEESNWDIEKAKDLLKEWGKDLAQKKSSRQASEGLIHSYIHSTGKVGVMIELSCETDFVAKSDDFKILAHEICLQIAAMNPEEPALLEQPWVKNPKKTIKELIEEYIGKIGENISLKRYVKYEI